jgi:hypothetical protein
VVGKGPAALMARAAPRRGRAGPRSSPGYKSGRERLRAGVAHPRERVDGVVHARRAGGRLGRRQRHRQAVHGHVQHRRAARARRLARRELEVRVWEGLRAGAGR